MIDRFEGGASTGAAVRIQIALGGQVGGPVSLMAEDVRELLALVDSLRLVRRRAADMATFAGQKTGRYSEAANMILGAP